ncbi:MAG: type II secretion system F family protein [Candidatus Sungbacteria bacterium]|uniref:Type II secretion system F family protein n=1 Tax=Candidatus Sungiibacteriota bacterium TaxID=2750080 RepID=A0A9D6LST1_9BACT|nr:type II secretion system F family protein [Candidatus Sungbacteria bacterium]
MSAFSYNAKTREGESRTGVVEAPSLESAIEVLQRNNLIILDVSPAAGPGFISKSRFNFFNRVKSKDIVLLSRQLSTLFEAKVPVIQALKTLVNETGSLPLKEAMGAILDDVNGGSSLSLAMSKHPRAFSAFYVSMVKSGEESGKLQDVFLYLADYLERSYNLASKAKNALIYPAFIFTTFVGVVIIMLVVVIPKLTAIFAETGQAVPLYTQIVISTSGFLRSWGWLLLIGIIVGLVFAYRYRQTDQGREVFDEIQLRLPIVGGLYRKIYLTRFADNLGTLIVAGIPILRALQITGEVVGNKIYEKAILASIESVKGGSTIASALQNSKYIPPLVTQMIKIGEEAGRLDSILKNVAKYYQRDVDNLLDNFVSLIEPALIIFLGVAVGGLVAAILVPLYNLSSAF